MHSCHIRLELQTHDVPINLRMVNSSFAICLSLMTFPSFTIFDARNLLLFIRRILATLMFVGQQYIPGSYSLLDDSFPKLFRKLHLLIDTLG